MTIGDKLRAKSIQMYGWDALSDEETQMLIKDLWDKKILDISEHIQMPITEVISIKEITDIFRADQRMQKQIIDRYSPNVSIAEAMTMIRLSPLLQDVITTRTANKVNRVLAYLTFKKIDLTDEEYDLLGLLLAKFGNPIGCSTPEMFEEKCKEDLEEMLAVNKPKKKKGGKK